MISLLKSDLKLSHFSTFNILLIYEMNVFTLLLVISKRLELQSPGWAHFEDFLMKINFLFLKSI